VADEPVVVTAAVEGDVDEALLRRILQHVGLDLGHVHGRKGKPHLLLSLAGYNNAARFVPWVVLIDLDDDGDCAPVCINRWLPEPSPLMRFRVAVRAVEAWLLADRERVATLLGISPRLVPNAPDNLANPKRALVDLARRSRYRKIREELAPREGSGRAVGPLYTTRITQFVDDTANGWRPGYAVDGSDSLRRCVDRLRSLVP